MHAGFLFWHYLNWYLWFTLISLYVMLQVSLVSFNVTSYLTRTCPHHVVPRVVHGCSVFHRSWHRHSLANRIASNGHKSISNMLRGFHPMGCNPTDTQMILSYHMGDRVFNHSRAVRPQILSLIIVIYIRFHEYRNTTLSGSESPASLQTEGRGFKRNKNQRSRSSSNLNSFLTRYRLQIS